MERPVEDRLFGFMSTKRDHFFFTNGAQMLVSETGRPSLGKIARVITGLVLIVFGLVLSSKPWLDIITERNLRMSDGSPTFNLWKNPAYTPLLKIYIFNITNPDGFLKEGEKPRLKEFGPFVYRQDMEMLDVVFHDNGTMSHRMRRFLRFVPEMSADRTLKFLVPNIPLLMITSQAAKMNPLVQFALGTGVRLIGLQPFVELTVEELLFGYDDALVKLGHEVLPLHLRPQARMGLLLGRNGTSNDVMSIFTGETGMENVGYIDNLNGQNVLPRWPASPCNSIKASQGTFWPPRSLTKSDTVTAYDAALCRILTLHRRSTGTMYGVEADRFTPTENAFASDAPENRCFCPDPDRPETCPSRGLQNIAPCQHGAPVYVSYPHFLDAEPSLVDAVEGLRPVRELHETSIIIQPKLGVTMHGHVRFQANLWVQRAKLVGPVSGFPTIVYPIMWLEEGIDDLPRSAKWLLYVTTTLAETVYAVLLYGSIVTGLLLLAAEFVLSYRGVMVSDRTLEAGRRWSRRRSSLLISGAHKMLIRKTSAWSDIN